jgi:aminopeptidase N
VQIEETNLPGNKKLTHYREEVPLPTKVMVIGAADFAVQHVGDIDCVPVTSWVYPENKEAGFFDYAIAKDILAWHINYIGTYAYKKLANVQSKTKFGGMENAGAIFYAEEKITGRREEERLLSHEIVHQWFGNMATEKSFAHLWLSEGFATYLTHVYMEARYGTDSMNKEMIADRNQIVDFVKYAARPVVDSTSNFMQMLNANSYQKGGWVLHMLRRQLGDSVFKKSIRQYYSTYAGKNAETKDLQQVFESVSGKNLENFFSQWLHTPVNPHLKITWSYDAAGKKINITIEQLQKGRVFELPLEIAIHADGGKKALQTLAITKRTETFSIPSTTKPVSLYADPNVSLLFEGYAVELK